MARRLLHRITKRLRAAAPGGELPLIQTGDPMTRMARAYGIQGKAIAPQLEDRIFPVTLVDDLTAQNPWLAPVDRKCIVRAAVPAIVAEFGLVTLSLASGSAVVIRIDRVTTEVAGALAFNFGYSTFTEATVEGPQFKDRRNGPVPAALVRSGTDALNQVNLPIGSITHTVNDATIDFDRLDLMIFNPLLLGAAAASNFAIQCATANTAFTAVLEWTEFSSAR